MSSRIWLSLGAAVLAAASLGCAGGGAGRDVGASTDVGGASEPVDDAASRDFGADGPLRAQPPRSDDLIESERLAEAARRLEPVFFAFDKFDLDAGARATLASNANWLRANPDIRVMIEGHCDERGTSEYNLALGERRARSVRDYLVQSGVESHRLRTISYGEERPFALGHDEGAWRLNRRAHFQPQLR